MTDFLVPSEIVVSSSREIAWFVPIDADDSQCLHINVRMPEREIVMLVSRYECLSGHRHSNLLQELVSREDEHAELELDVHDIDCDMVATFKYMHSDQSTLDFDVCSALLYAKTAKFMRIPKLIEIMTNLAEERLRKAMDSNNSSFMTLWDAVAILYLFDDPHKLLSSLDPIHYASSNPEIFTDTTLFSSCRDIYTPHDMVGAVSGIINHYHREHESIVKTHEKALTELHFKYSTLQSSINEYLAQYIGCRLEFTVTKTSKATTFSRCTVMRLSATCPGCLDVLWDSGEVGKVNLGDIKVATKLAGRKSKENRLINL